MLYPVFLIITALEMLYEVAVSRRNSAGLIEKGAVEIAPGILPVMTLLYLILYAGSFAEFLWIPRPVGIYWSVAFIALFLAAKALKFWAVRTLGPYWTMRVLIVPSSKTVSGGPYRFIRHPNYVAVLMEIAAIALLGKCFFTFAAVFSVFVVVLYFRIRSEENALALHTDYRSSTGLRRRFLP